MKRTSRHLAVSISAILLLATHAVSAQTIDISSGLTEVESQLASIYSSAMNIAMTLFGLGALIGLIITAYQLYTDEHGQGWKKSLSWFGILAFICIALYAIKQMFNI